MNLQRTLASLAAPLVLLPLTAEAVLISASVTEVKDQNGMPLVAGTSAALVIDIDGNGLQPESSPTVILDSLNDGTSFLGGDLVVALSSSDELFGITEIDFPLVDVDLSGPASVGDQYYIVWFPGDNTGLPGLDPGVVEFELADVHCLWVTGENWQIPTATPPPGAGNGMLTFGQIGEQGHIPEPSHMVLLLCGGMLALGRRSRR